MWNGSEKQAALIRESIEKGGLEHIDVILDAIESTGAITYTFSIAEAEAAKAKQALRDVPPSPYLDALNALAEFAVHRSS